VPQYQLDELPVLETHMFQRLTASDANQDLGERMRDWVRFRFSLPLRSLLVAARWGGRFYFLLNVIIVGAGFATSGIAAAGSGNQGKTSTWLVFSFGLAVAISGGVTQLYRPGHRATERATLADQMRQHGWSFANGTGIYAGDVTKAFELLESNIDEFHRRATRVVSLEDASSSKT
jgi:hypothetical protein